MQYHAAHGGMLLDYSAKKEKEKNVCVYLTRFFFGGGWTGFEAKKRRGGS